MSKTRMAGEALSDAARNRQIREEIGNDAERLSTRISGIDRDKYDFSGFTDKEINMAYQGDTFDENDYARLTGKTSAPSDGGDSSTGGNSGGSGSGSTPSTPIIDKPTTPVPGPAPLYGSGNIQQDNDITTTINGDNNTVDNFQDNSINRSMGSSDYATRYARGLKDRYVLNLLDR